MKDINKFIFAGIMCISGFICAGGIVSFLSYSSSKPMMQGNLLALAGTIISGVICFVSYKLWQNNQ